MTTASKHPDAEASRLTTQRVWDEVVAASFAVLSYVTPSGAPRSCGVVYKALDRRLYVVTQQDSWKARHIGADGRVAVTVPVRRGGLLALLFPIPPATISFHGTATVHPPGTAQVRAIRQELMSLLPEQSQSSVSVIEVAPEGDFVSYGIAVSLQQMRDPAIARSRCPVTG